MTVNRNLRLPDLLAFLEASERQDQELRAVIASDLTSTAQRMQALLELAQLSSDLTASSAVNLPITSASLRLVVIWTGVESTRCTYSGARVPPRLTFTTNLIFFMVFPMRFGMTNKWEAR